VKRFSSRGRKFHNAKKRKREEKKSPQGDGVKKTCIASEKKNPPVQKKIRFLKDGLRPGRGKTKRGKKGRSDGGREIVTL